MNVYLERVCQMFGNTNCESASGSSLFLMILLVAVSLVAVCWIAGRVRDAFAA